VIHRKDLRVRDPFILVHENRYYLYATTGETTLSYYTSTDLEMWEYGGTAFEIPKDFWAVRDVWAAEVHSYRGKYWLFVSLLGKNGLRGTQVAVCDTPKGPFVPLVDRAVTPQSQSCIDGTLYVHEGVPYIFYSHDWPDNYVTEKSAYVGQICGARLREDLTAIEGEPWVLFDSDESPISKAEPHPIVWEGKKGIRYGSDAPFVQKLTDGRLLLTWSPYLQDNYVVLGAVSESGSVRGPWTHLEKPLYDQNGGHAMFFRDPNGKLCMCLHGPEAPQLERAHIFEMEEPDGVPVIAKEMEMGTQ
jgi:hypothetical protein